MTPSEPKAAPDTDARFDTLMGAVARGNKRRIMDMNQAHVQAEAAKTEIASRLDYICRIVDDIEPRYKMAADAGSELAGVVYEFIGDPEAVGTDRLLEAYNKYLSLHAGNFYVAASA